MLPLDESATQRSLKSAVATRLYNCMNHIKMEETMHKDCERAT